MFMPEFCFGTCNASQKRRGHQHPSGNWTAARGRERWDGKRWGLVLFSGIINTFSDLLSGLGLIFWGCKHVVSGSLFVDFLWHLKQDIHPVWPQYIERLGGASNKPIEIQTSYSLVAGTCSETHELYPGGFFILANENVQIKNPRA